MELLSSALGSTSTGSPSRDDRCRPAVAVVVFCTVVGALGLTPGCTGSRWPTSTHDQLFGQGLTSCTEQCRPFGVLHFGLAVGPDGALRLECECMPGPEPPVEQEPEEQEPEEREPEEQEPAGEEPGGDIDATARLQDRRPEPVAWSHA